MRAVTAARGLSKASFAPALVLAAAALPGCDFVWKARSDDGKTRIEASGSSSLALAEAARPDGLLPPVRRGRPVAIRFTAPLDARSAREAFRVVDETRGDEAVPVVVEVAGAEARLRPASPAGFRAGARLRVTVAGLPSLRALRGAGGERLAADAVARLEVVPARAGRRSTPALLSSVPADGATDADPAAAVVLRFSADMEVPSAEGDRVPRRALRLEADGVRVPFRIVPDRSHREFALVPEGGLPPGSEVLVAVGPGLRDAEGNAFSPGTEIRFSVRESAAGPVGWVAEAFEDGAREDRRGTTVPWGDPLAPRLLVGVVEPLPLEVGGGGRARPLGLDPRGGRLRLLVPAADLGEERRLLKGLFLPAVPGGARGEILGLEVRAAPASGLVLPEDAISDALAWRTLVEAGDPLAPKASGPGYAAPFRRGYPHDGVSDMLVEIAWTGVTGTVVLRGAEAGSPRTAVRLADGTGWETVLAPDLRFDALGERAVALSRWLDSGATGPRWGAPVLRPAGAGVQVLLQGAPDHPGGGPDAAGATAWTTDPEALAGMRWIRFRVLFDGPPGGAPAEVDDLAIPFSNP